MRTHGPTALISAFKQKLILFKNTQKTLRPLKIKFRADFWVCFFHKKHRMNTVQEGIRSVDLLYKMRVTYHCAIKVQIFNKRLYKWDIG